MVQISVRMSLNRFTYEVVIGPEESIRFGPNPEVKNPKPRKTPRPVKVNRSEPIRLVILTICGWT